MNTENYGLYLTDDNSTRFQEWREKMNGAADSNMVKIDTALGQKADKSTNMELTLSAQSWSGEEAPYLQTITVEGLTDDLNGFASISKGATTEQVTAVLSAALSIYGQENDQLTIAANRIKPTVDLPVCIVLFG